MPYCDKHRLGTCCGERHCVPFSRLHAKPKALYKAVVDAPTDDERAAAVAALEEYEGSNGRCDACRIAGLSESAAARARAASAAHSSVDSDRRPVAGNLCKACGNRKADGKKTNPKARTPCAACAAKRAATAAPST